MSKRRLAIDKRLSRIFPDYKIELVDKGEDKETVAVNGIEINIAWIPHSKDWSDKQSRDILVRDCRESIEKLLNSL